MALLALYSFYQNSFTSILLSNTEELKTMLWNTFFLFTINEDSIYSLKQCQCPIEKFFPWFSIKNGCILSN